MAPRRRAPRGVSKAVMSDKILLVSVEDLIYTAFGHPQKNVVNFKLLHTVLNILARQMRLLEQDVEIKIDEIASEFFDMISSSSSTEEDEDKGRPERGRQRDKRRDRARKEEKGDKKERGEKDEKAEKGRRKDRRGKGEKEDGKTSSKDREGKGHSKDRDDKEKRSRDGDDKEKRSRDRDDKDKRSRDGDDKDKPSRDRDDKDKRSRDRDDKDKGSRDRDDKDKRSRDRDDKDKGSRDRDDKDKRSRDRDDKDKRSRDIDKRSRDKDESPRGRRSEDYGDEGGRERGRDRERGGERGADGRGGRGGEREDHDAQGQVRRGRDFGRQASGTSITVSETTRMGAGGSADKILVAERGPATRVRPVRIGSIEVVTASQFALLGKAVKQLEQITGPLPEPVLPDNETLRQDLAKGRASLQDTMEAVQLNARVQAAEQGLYRMAELLTQLAQSGMLPPKFAGHVGSIEQYLKAAKAAGHVGAGAVEQGKSDGPGGIRGTGPTASQMDVKNSEAVEAESQFKAGVTHNDMYEVLNQMKDALFKEVNNLSARANRSADMASNIARSIADKMDIAMLVDARVTELLQQTEDYANQLGGFDFGIKSQVNNFEEQLVLMREDLAGGLALLDASNNNAETAALLDLTARHQGLVVELENTVHLHHFLHITQQQIGDEIRSLVKCIEMLRDQKADRDEVVDGLKDKADLSRLAGLLNEKDFAYARSEIESRISKCYEAFNRQDTRWRDVLSELMALANNKAEIIMLMSLKDATNTELNSIQKLLCKLEIMLGEPKAAMLMRQLAQDASCAACLTRALMEPEDPTYGKPLPLPALRPPPLGAEQQPCVGDVKLAPPDIRDHTCRRWVGGSHTLMTNIAKLKTEHMKVQTIPTKKFEGYGFDGRLYMMEEDMQPCAECNQLSTNEAALVSPHPPTPSGAGDQASAPTRRR